MDYKTITSKISYENYLFLKDKSKTERVRMQEIFQAAVDLYVKTETSRELSIANIFYRHLSMFTADVYEHVVSMFLTSLTLVMENSIRECQKYSNLFAGMVFQILYEEKGDNLNAIHDMENIFSLSREIVGYLIGRGGGDFFTGVSRACENDSALCKEIMNFYEQSP